VREVTEGFPLDPRARTLWSVLAGGAAALASILVAIPLVLADLVPVAVAVVVVAPVPGVLWARAAWVRFRWAEGPDALELRHGVVVHRSSFVPYHRLQQIDVERGPLERMAGLAELVLRTASATTDARLPGLAEAEAHRLRVHLLERAGVDDAV
jgi:membrane protein YdbS with pleckstrin-like domain